MAEQWRREHPGAQNSVLAEGLTNILRSRLSGVDVSETACRIATFSLYLALLDQLEPRDIQKLQSARWKLPSLLHLSDAPSVPPSKATIFQGNFFDRKLPVSKGAFDLVIGNPPWVGRGEPKDPSFAQWCGEHKDMDVPENQMAHGFMWRAPEYLIAGGRGCFVLPAAVLLNKTTNDFQGKWFRRFAVDKVTQLSDLSFVLFVGSDRPAVVVRFRNEPPVLSQAGIVYAAPKADPQSLRGGPPRIFEQDCWHVRQSEVLLRAGAETAPVVWKERLWGTPRDLRFIDRLLDIPPLGDLAGPPGSGKRWVEGVGFKPFDPTRRKRKPARKEKVYDAWWPRNHLFVGAGSDFSLVLVPHDAGPVGDRFRKLHRSPSETLFRPPMVLFNRGFTKVAFCNFPVLFRHWLHSIAGPRQDEDIIRFLAATLASDLATYFLFHTAGSWGTERDQTHVFEVLRMPFALPSQTVDPGRAEEIVAKVSARLARLEGAVIDGAGLRAQLVHDARRDLWPMIREYYDIDGWEEMLIEDTLRISEKSSTPGGPSADIPALRAPGRGARERYADMLCQVLNTWGRGSGYTVNRLIVAPRAASVGVITLAKDRAPREPMWSEGSQELDRVLAKIARLLPQRQAGIDVVRGMKVFDRNELHIVKPLMLRFWTRTAALNDADEIASAILRAR